MWGLKIHLRLCSYRRYEMCTYELRQNVRCPKKYGESTKRRKFVPASSCDLDHVSEQTETDSQKPLDDRYKRNAAVLPDLSPPCSSSSSRFDIETTSSTAETISSAPLLIHGFTVPQYQQTYHLVADPLLFSPRGKPAAYSLKLGRVIKERLFREVAYPLFQDLEQSSGKVEVTERFCVLRPTPHIDVN